MTTDISLATTIHVWGGQGPDGTAWVGRTHPPLDESRDPLKLTGHCLVVTEVDWLSLSPDASYVINTVGDNGIALPLLYGSDIPLPDTDVTIGSWRSAQGAVVPPHFALDIGAISAVGMNSIIRGYWVPENAFAPLVYDPDPNTQVPMPPMPRPPMPV